MTTKITSANITQSGTSGISSVAWQAVQTTGFTAVAGRAYPCNTTSAAFTVTLPASPAAGNVITLTDYAGTFGTNNLTINPNGGKVNGITSNVTLNTDRGSVQLVYVDATQGWIAYSAFAISALGVPVDYLIAASGGAGGGYAGGGGGAGGVKTGSTSLTKGVSFTVTVGASVSTGSGNASSFSGSGFTTISTTGGGQGGLGGGAGTPVRVAASGGSGGGGGSTANGGNSLSGAAGTSGEGNAGGNSSGGAGNFASAGGGGKGAAGTTPASTSSGGGNGGVGIEWPTGSGVYYGGGGGGACGDSTPTAGTGGNGGGGNGSVHSLATGNVNTQGTAGSPNTGGGGGGGGTTADKNAQFASGSGVVILRYPDSYAAAASTTGSPTVTVSGGYRTYKFTGNGSITF